MDCFNPRKRVIGGLVTGCPADRINPIQVSLHYKSNNALFHIYLLKLISYRFPWTRPPRLGSRPSQTDVQWSWSGHLAIWSCCRWPNVSFIFRFPSQDYPQGEDNKWPAEPDEADGPSPSCLQLALLRECQLFVTSIPCLYVVFQSLFWNIYGNVKFAKVC